MYPTITSQVSFRLLSKRCMACHLLTYPTMSWRVLFPVVEHFMMLTLKHYKVIKDCVETLQDCNPARQDMFQRRKIKSFSLFWEHFHLYWYSWEIFDATQGFDAKFCIGEGGYGTVYKAQLISGDTFAVKKLTSLCDGNISQQKEFLNEIRALTEIRH